jgi:hypothetical protein
VLTIRQYYLMVRGYWMRDERAWDHTRFLSAWIHNTRPGLKKNQMFKPEQIMQLPHVDKGTVRERKKVVVKKRSQEEIEQIYKIFGFTPK